MILSTKLSGPPSSGPARTACPPPTMASMINAATETQHPTNGVHPTEPDNLIYERGELPEGLIDLPSASEKYGIRVDTLRSVGPAGKIA